MLEQTRLVVLAEQVEDRVVGDQYDVERTVGEVAGDVAPHRVDESGRVSLAQLGEHGLAAVDTDDAEARVRHRHSETSGTDPEFEHAPADTGELDHPRDGGVDVGDVGVPLVVHVGEPVAVRTMVVSPHPPKAMPRLQQGSDPCCNR